MSQRSQLMCSTFSGIRQKTVFSYMRAKNWGSVFSRFSFGVNTPNQRVPAHAGADQLMREYIGIYLIPVQVVRRSAVLLCMCTCCACSPVHAVSFEDDTRTTHLTSSNPNRPDPNRFRRRQHRLLCYRHRERSLESCASRPAQRVAAATVDPRQATHADTTPAC